MAAVLALAAALGTGGASRLGAQQVQVSQANRTIAITATENAERRADVATLHIGYQVYALDSAHAYAEAASISQAVAAALEKAGVAKDSIASESQSTQEAQEFRNPNLTPEERAQRRFEAQQSWAVKTTPDAVAHVLAEAVNAGANSSGNIDWSVADEESLTEEASAKALTHARDIASQMAKGLGAKVGNLMYASNQVEAIQPRVMLQAAPASMSGMGSGMGGGFATPRLNLSAPMITRTATVSAIFAIE
jgi:uncharacterized protein YggE